MLLFKDARDFPKASPSGLGKSLSGVGVQFPNTWLGDGGARKWCAKCEILQQKLDSAMLRLNAVWRADHPLFSPRAKYFVQYVWNMCAICNMDWATFISVCVFVFVLLFCILCFHKVWCCNGCCVEGGWSSPLTQGQLALFVFLFVFFVFVYLCFYFVW